MPTTRDLAELVRAPAALSVPGDVVAGAAAAGAPLRHTPGLAGASVLLYWAGMAANDWADRALDAVERPERPIPSGRVAPVEALGIAAGLTAAGLAVAAAAGGRRAFAVAVPLAATVWAYDLRAKNTPAGPAVMASCRALDVLLGAAPAGLRGMRRAVPAALTVAAHTYTVTALSRREVTGADPALPAVTLAGTAVVAALAARGGPGGRDEVVANGDRTTTNPSYDGGRGLLPAALAGWYAARYGAAQARAAADPSAPRIRAAVGAGITALPALQGALAARAGAAATGALVAAAAPIGRRLARRMATT
jgi:4-hydroxybenzoate polyprenyltransferase